MRQPLLQQVIHIVQGSVGRKEDGGMTIGSFHQLGNSLRNGADIRFVLAGGQRQIIRDVQSCILAIIEGRTTSAFQNGMLRNLLVHAQFCFEVGEAAVITDGSRSQHPMAVGCLPQILADQITDICRDTCQGCGFRAAVQFDPAHILLALQHPEGRNHILATHHLVVL